ncbi:hypothetical protein [Acetobacter oryzifermentans]|nr:hypothetical protein [Acetobacter oryzifermentans]
MAKKTKNTKNTKKVNRSSETGQFVTQEYAKAHPSTTETQHIKKAPKRN